MSTPQVQRLQQVDGEIHVAHWPGSEQQPPIVMLHEGLGCVARWKDWPQWLAQQTAAHVWAFDRIGHGQSDPLPQSRTADYLHREAWQRLPDYLNQLKIRNPVLFGHSDGGSIALLYASRYACAGVFSLAAHVLVEPLSLAGVRRAKADYPNWRKRFKEYHGAKSDALLQAWADTWLSDDFADWNIEASLPAISCPCLCLQGQEDAYGSPKQLERIRQNNVAIETRLLPGLNHQAHLEAPERIRAHWTNFWEQQLAR